MPKWQRAFEDWQALLRQTQSLELLNDPIAVWDEAWRAATMEIIQIVGRDMPTLAERLTKEFL